MIFTKFASAAVLSVALAATGPAFAGNIAEPILEEEVIVEETNDSSGFIIPLILLAVIAAVVATSGGGSTITDGDTPLNPL